jgi:integrase
LIPFTRRVCACLSLWLSRFPNAERETFVFPSYKVGIGGNSRSVGIYDLDLERPMGSWRLAWLEACKRAGVRYRWHDLRYTFVSRLAENATISEQTIRSLAGHVSRQMLEHYSHIRSGQTGCDSMPGRTGQHANFRRGRAQNRAQ